MFLDVGTALRMALLLLSQLLCRQPSNYETRSISLTTMNAWNRLYSYLYAPQWYIAVSFNKCTLCKSIWTKASAKWPQCKWSMVNVALALMTVTQHHTRRWGTSNSFVFKNTPTVWLDVVLLSAIQPQSHKAFLARRQDSCTVALSQSSVTQFRLSYFPCMPVPSPRSAKKSVTRKTTMTMEDKPGVF